MAGLVATNYSEALFMLALEEDKLQSFYTDLNKIRDVLYENKDLKNIMKHPKVHKSDKKEILEKVFNDCDPYVLNFISLMIDKSRFSHFDETCKCFIQMYNDHYGIEIAYVESASTLSEEEKTAIQNMLEKRTNKKIEMRCRVNEDLLAGLRIRIKDEVLDHSAAAHLSKMKDQVMKSAL